MKAYIVTLVLFIAIGFGMSEFAKALNQFNAEMVHALIRK